MKKIFLVFTFLSILLCGCSAKSTSEKAQSIIEKDMNCDIIVSECLFNKDSNAVFVKFHSSEYGDDEAIVTLKDNKVFYESVYSEIGSTDYDKLIEYGDYSLMMYDITVNGGENWKEVE